MKRGMEADMILYFALNRMCLNECFEKYSNLFQKINPMIKNYVESFNDIDTSKDYLIQCQSLIDNLSDESFFELLHKFKEEMKGQPKFYLNFMKMYEILLLFTRATRQGLWDLHLASLELMIPFFFAHDLQNYARLMPEYIAQMNELKNIDPEIWHFFQQGNFSVNKSPHPFSAIGADHGIEQLNRELKVVGGVKGLLMNKNALHRFTLVAPVLDSICQSFSQINNLAKETRDKHYQLSGSTNCRIISNADKLHSYFQSLDVIYANSDCV